MVYGESGLAVGVGGLILLFCPGIFDGGVCPRWLVENMGKYRITLDGARFAVEAVNVDPASIWVSTWDSEFPFLYVPPSVFFDLESDVLREPVLPCLRILDVFHHAREFLKKNVASLSLRYLGEVKYVERLVILEVEEVVRVGKAAPKIKSIDHRDCAYEVLPSTLPNFQNRQLHMEELCARVITEYAVEDVELRLGEGLQSDVVFYKVEYWDRPDGPDIFFRFLASLPEELSDLSDPLRSVAGLVFRSLLVCLFC